MYTYISLADIRKMNPFLLNKYIKIYDVLKDEVDFSDFDIIYEADETDILRHWIYRVVFLAAQERFGEDKADEIANNLIVSLDKTILNYSPINDEEKEFVDKVNKILKD